MVWGKVKPGSLTDRIRKQLENDKARAESEGRVYNGPKNYKNGRFVW